MLHSGVPAFTLVTGVLSNVVSNVAAVLLMRPEIAAFPDPHQAWLVLAMASTLAGNFTLLGSAATLIVAVDHLEPEGARLCGPGIRASAQLSLPGIPALQANTAMFPLGFYCLFTCGTRIAALPRSTRLEVC